MYNEQVIKPIRTVIASKTKHMLKYVYLHHDKLTVGDEGNFLTLPFQSGIEACIPAKEFCKALETMQQHPTFEWKTQDSVLLTDGSHQQELTAINRRGYPSNFLSIGFDYHQIGEWTGTELSYLKNALAFVNTKYHYEALRGVKASDEIVGSDGTHLYHVPIDSLLEDLIIPVKTAKILLSFGNQKDWSIFRGNCPPPSKKQKRSQTDDDTTPNHYGAFVSDGGIILSFIPIQKRYMDYKVVIPKDRPLLTLTVQVKKLLPYLKEAVENADPNTGLVVLTLDGTFKISSTNPQMNSNYKQEVACKHEFHQPNDGHFQIGFKGTDLVSIIKQIKGEVSFQFYGAQKGALINEHYLIQPSPENA